MPFLFNQWFVHSIHRTGPTAGWTSGSLRVRTIGYIFASFNASSSIIRVSEAPDLSAASVRYRAGYVMFATIR